MTQFGKNESRVINSDSICLDSVWSRTMRYNSIQSYTIFRSITFGYMTNESNTYFCSITFVYMTNDSLYNFRSITFDHITFVRLYNFYPYDFWSGDSTFVYDPLSGNIEYPPQWKLGGPVEIGVDPRSGN